MQLLAVLPEESLACSLCWALLFGGPQRSHISTKLHLFCKACSFSPRSACSDTWIFPSKSSSPRSQPALQAAGLFSQTTGVREGKNHFKKKKNTPQFLFLCLGLSLISTVTKPFHGAPQDLLFTPVPRASLSQLTDGAFPNLLPR